MRLAQLLDRVSHEEDRQAGALLGKLEAGPPLYSPLKLLDPVANMHEMFVHHEDVRRAKPGWEPRHLDDKAISALRRPLPVFVRMGMAKVPARVSLQPLYDPTMARIKA